MKRKGFTLIELLAVIVVLAIIALIATPIVMNVIKDAQKGATERSAERYIKAVETAIATDMLQSIRVKDGIYDVDGNGNLTSEGKVVLNVAVNGDIPEAESKVAIENGQVVKEGTNLDYVDYSVTIDDKGSATATEKGAGNQGEVATAICNAIAPPEERIFVEVCGNSCWDECWDEDGEEVCEETCEYSCWDEPRKAVVGVQATEANPYALGTVYSCDLGDGARIFYVLKEEGNNVKLIMNENIGHSVWAESGDNRTGPVAPKTYLAGKTSGWKKLKDVGGIVDLPSAQDIADAIGDEEWTPASYESEMAPTWMSINMSETGYWTLTPCTRTTELAWFFYMSLDYELVDEFAYVRPLITIPKANMSL